MTRDLSVEDVSRLIECSDWVNAGVAVKQGDQKQAIQESTDPEQDEMESGFYELDEGIIVYLSENGTLYDVFSDDEDNVFLFNEEVGLFQTYQDNQDLVFEAVDPAQFDLLEEDTDQDADSGDFYDALP